MNATDQHIKQVQEKLQLLLKRFAALQKENEGLKQELATLKASAGSTQQTIDQLQQRVEILKLNNLGMNEQEKKQLEKKINTYVKEIDRCIALLKD